MDLDLHSKQRSYDVILDKSLDHLSRALPISGRALFLRTSFNRSIIDSLRYLLEICNEVIPTDLFTKVDQKLNSLNLETKLSGLLSIIHTDLFSAAEQKNVPRVN